MGDRDRVEFRGETVDRRTAAMLVEAERLAQVEDPSIGDFVLNQGSFSHSVSASGGTHGGPGAFDLSTRGYSDEQNRIIGLALRRVGFASWLRTPDQGNWGEHFHGIAMGTKGLPWAAQVQVQNYLDGRTGLRRGGDDDQERPKRIRTWEQYQAAAATRENEERKEVDEDETPACNVPEHSGIGSGGTDHHEGDATRTVTTVSPADPEKDRDRDSDNDGLTDSFEKLVRTDAHDPDTDKDGLLDGYEARTTHTDPLSRDGDRDGASDADELAAATDPGRLEGIGGVIGVGALAENVRRGFRDADRDGLSDRMEKLVGTNPNQADTDADKLDDATEATLGTDPTLADSDHDGVTDGLEVSVRRDPLSAVLDRDGRAVATERWTPEAAHRRRLAADNGDAGQQRLPARQADSVATGGGHSHAEPAGAQHGFTVEKGTYGELRLTSSMADVASTIVATTDEVGRELGWDDGMRRRAAIIAVATAMKESTLGDDPTTNRPNHDQDAGVFQQRVKPGWYGTLEQVNDVRWATRAFLLGHKVEKTIPGGAGDEGYVIPGLAQIDDWQHLTYSQASHRVQVSAYPKIPDRFIDMAEAVWDEATEDGKPEAARADTERRPQDPTRLPGADDVDLDTDADGLTDAFEKLAGTDPQKFDTDGDEHGDGYEALTAGSDPLRDSTVARVRPVPGTAGVIGSGIFAENVRGGLDDADSDGVSDRTEKLLGLGSTSSDDDEDGLDDATELALGTSPKLFDTDGDGVSDRYEVDHRLNPLDPNSNLGSGLGQGFGNGVTSTTPAADAPADTDLDSPAFPAG